MARDYASKTFSLSSMKTCTDRDQTSGQRVQIGRRKVQSDKLGQENKDCDLLSRSNTISMQLNMCHRHNDHHQNVNHHHHNYKTSRHQLKRKRIHHLTNNKWFFAPDTSVWWCCLLILLVCCQASATQARLVANGQRRLARQVPETTVASLATTGSETTVGSTSVVSSEETTTTTSAPSRSGSKFPPVNFTQVLELFERSIDEQEAAKKWKKMDRTLTEGVRALLKVVFPHIVNMAADAKVSGNCQGAILKWILNLRNMREWAVKMLDAIGKPSAGILEGSLTLFGNYKQCLRVRAPDEDEIEISDDEFREYFRGQYCVLQLKPALPPRRPFYSLNTTIAGLQRKSYKYYEKSVYDSLAELAMAFNFVNIRADLCVPSLCSRDDIQRVADFLANKLDFRAQVQRCDIEPSEWQYEQTHVIWALIFALLLLLVLISTLTSVILKLASAGRRDVKLALRSSGARSLMTSMSLYRSLNHMKNVRMDRINDSKPVFLYTLRLIIILWIFLTSLCSQLDFQYLRELLSLRSVIMQWPMQLIVNSSLQFEALILLTAFTFAYQNVHQAASISDLLKHMASKYSRLMPSIMLFVAMTIITPLIYPNRSPVWHDFVDRPAQVCKENGLINLSFLQNLLLPADEICLPQTWIFCVEFQLCLLAIPIVLALNRSFDAAQGRFKLTSGPVLSLLALATGGCFINFWSIYSRQLPAAWFLTYPDKRDKTLYFSEHLYKTWSHLSSFAIGLLAGHLCRCMSMRGSGFSGKPYGRRCCDNLVWLASFGTMAGLIFGTHEWSLSGTSHLESPLASALYAALAPFAWSTCCALILFLLCIPATSKHHQGQISNLLANDVNLVRLGRLSFLAYLINPYVNTLVLAIQEQAIFSSFLMLGHTFLGNLIITFTLAFVISALVELPCRRIIKKLLIGARRQSTNFDILARQMDQGQLDARRPQAHQHSYLANLPTGGQQPLKSAS